MLATFFSPLPPFGSFLFISSLFSLVSLLSHLPLHLFFLPDLFKFPVCDTVNFPFPSSLMFFLQAYLYIPSVLHSTFLFLSHLIFASTYFFLSFLLLIFLPNFLYTCSLCYILRYSLFLSSFSF